LVVRGWLVCRLVSWFLFSFAGWLDCWFFLLVDWFLVGQLFVSQSVT